MTGTKEKRTKAMHHVIAFLLALWLPVCVRAGESPTVGWVLGAVGVSCETACTGAGGTCNAENSIITPAQGLYVNAIFFDSTCYQEPYCTLGEKGFTCDVTDDSTRLVCCCSNDADNCPTSEN